MADHPVSCRHCHTTEASAWLLDLNHGAGRAPWAAEECMAMHLTRNHVRAALTYPQFRDRLDEYIDRAAELWPADSPWLTEARKAAQPPAHEDVATEAVALW